jgi:hypothetical protein
MAGLVIGFAAPIVLVIHALWCGIAKDGSPLRRDWWTS